jgi:hypothetical protein
MANSAFSGPLIVFGQNPNQPSDYNPDIGGSSLFYAGTGILDPRIPFTFLPGESQAAVDYGWLGVDNITTLSAVPYTASSTAIVASANPTSATLALVTSSSSTTGVYYNNTNFVRSDTGATDTVLALDAYASVTGSFSNGVLTITASSNQMPIGPGMVVISTSGTVSQGTALGTQVFAQLTTTGTYSTVSQGTTGTYQTNGNLTATSGTVVLAYQNVQQCAVPNNAQTPSQGNWSSQALLGRAVSVTAASGATYTTASVNGYDIYGYPMTENITITAGSTVNGKKAFKYIKSVVLSGGTADTTHAYSVGTADVFGLPLRSDTFGDIIVNNASSLVATTLITAATNYLPSDRTTPSATTADVRGTFAATSSSGANKLIVRQSPQAYMVPYTTGLFGLTQYYNF